MGSDCNMEENKENVYTEKVGKQTFIVNLRSAEDAKLTHEELVKRLIYKASSHLKADNT